MGLYGFDEKLRRLVEQGQVGAEAQTRLLIGLTLALVVLTAVLIALTAVLIART